MGSRGARRIKILKDPEKGAPTAPNGGASGGGVVLNGTKVPTKNGPGPHGDSAHHTQESQSDSLEGRFDKNHKKRARRRKRGKSKQALASTEPVIVTSVSPLPAKTGKKRRPNRFRRRGRAGIKPADTIPPIVAATAKSSPVAPVQATQRRESRHFGAPLYAALDLGTNNCRLLVAAPTRPGQFRVVDAFSRIVRLGEGLGATGRLNDNAMDRAIEALKICRDKLETHDVRRARLIATEACRQASNGEEFLARVKSETGLELEIINRQTEARLAVSGCGTLVERETDAVVLFDIGGGSSEIALIDVSERRSPRLAEHIIAWTSLPVGVVTLAERFGGRDVTTDNFAVMVDHVAELINDFSERHKLGDLVKSQNFHLLGTSGTVTTLAGIHLGLERYDRRRIDGIWMQNDDVTEMTSKLLSWSFDERVANPCIGADRADLVLAGCAILDAIRNVWPSQKLRVADRGLREGILTELMSRDGAWRNRWLRATA
jgi:exopolyphosphatase / guanosine-5'-triphosphate,3'-diphosphate pyrophosphatase